MADQATITTEPTRETTVIGAGGATETSISFEFFEEDGSDIDVYIDGVLTTAYEITPNYGTTGGYMGGTITWDAEQASVTIVAVLQQPLQRTANFPLSGAFDIGSLNLQLNKLWAVHKQQQDEIDRSLKLTITDATGADVQIPSPTGNAGKVIAIWNDDEDALVIGPDASQIASAETFATQAAASASDAAGDAADAHTDALAAAAAAASITIPLSVASGGTAAATASDARANLGLTIGTHVEAHDADILKADTTDALTVGFYQSADHDYGEIAAAGTLTVDLTKMGCAKANLPAAGSTTHTIAPDASRIGVQSILLTSGAGGSYTLVTSGFTKVFGTFNTGANKKHELLAKMHGSFSILYIDEVA